jgi:Flp pilus assembly pilin Flp
MPMHFRRWLRRADGQDLIEYAILAAFVSLAAYGAGYGMGGSFDGWYAALAQTIGGDRGNESSAGESGSPGKSNCSATGMAKSKGKCHGG